MRLVHARCLKLGAVTLVAGILSVWCYTLQTELKGAGTYTGWVLFGVLVFLMVFNGVRKLQFLSFANARFWSQLHIYTGLLSIVLFLWHLDFRFPSGFLEVLLSILFILLATSGIFGLIIYRTFPKRLTERGEDVIYERIPEYRHRLKSLADESIKRHANKGGAQILTEYYIEHLASFFSGPKHFFSHVLERNHHRYLLLVQMRALHRYLEESERATLRSLIGRVQQKDDLDYHFALQSLLKFWLCFHIPLGVMLLLFSIVHLVLATAFSGV